MSGCNGLSTAVCPRTGEDVTLVSGLWDREGPIEINCSSCGKVHYWDARQHRLTDEPPDPRGV